MNTERRSLTKAVFFAALSKQYLEDFKRDCSQQDKQLAKGWINKIDCMLSNIYAVMNPESREQYLKEIVNADIFVYDELFRLTLMMDKNQRELLETVANGIVKGELIEFTGNETTQQG